jgi:hypothetical protein
MSNLNQVFFYIEKYFKSEGYAKCFLEVLKDIIEPNEEVEFYIVLDDSIARQIVKREFVISEINEFIANRDNLIS